LAQWWVSVKTKSTPDLFKNCVKLPEPEPEVEDKEVDLYTLAKREDEDAFVIIESFIRGTWESWFEENSKMKPIVEREWNAVREDRKFWTLLCGNRNPRTISLLFAFEKYEPYIDWQALSANPAIFKKQ
jgi:hypothetical protein